MPDTLKLDLEYEEWHAVHDRLSDTLRVDGICVVPSGGFATSLAPAEPQGINAQMLLLVLAVFPTGESPSRQPLHFDTPWPEGGAPYTEVGFRVEGADAPPPPTLVIEDIS